MTATKAPKRSATKTSEAPETPLENGAVKPAPVKRESGGIQSIERAISIVDLVANNPDGISLAELSDQMGLNNSTVFHLVKTLNKLGIVTQSTETKRYHVGSHLFTLAAGALTEKNMMLLATPILERLSATTGEAANLAVRLGNEVMVITRTAATGELQLSSRPGTTRPIHVTATGKVLLSTMAKDDLAQLLASYSFKSFTPNSITTHEALYKELDDIRNDGGIAYDRCEFDLDVACVATTVKDFAGRHIAALGISGPVWRMKPKSIQRKTKELLKAAAEISAKFGGQS